MKKMLLWLCLCLLIIPAAVAESIPSKAQAALDNAKFVVYEDDDGNFVFSGYGIAIKTDDKKHGYMVMDTIGISAYADILSEDSSYSVNKQLLELPTLATAQENIECDIVPSDFSCVGYAKIAGGIDIGDGCKLLKETKEPFTAYATFVCENDLRTVEVKLKGSDTDHIYTSELPEDFPSYFLPTAPLVDKDGAFVGTYRDGEVYSSYWLAKIMDANDVDYYYAGEMGGIFGHISCITFIIVCAILVIVIVSVVIIVPKMKKKKNSVTPSPSPVKPDAHHLSVYCLCGTLADQSFDILANKKIGRDGSACEILYPDNEPGISKIHCLLSPMPDDSLMLTDLESSYGTFIGDKKLTPFSEEILHAGDRFSLADGRNTFEVRLS